MKLTNKFYDITLTEDDQLILNPKKEMLILTKENLPMIINCLEVANEYLFE